jgi:phospholipid N-methyltransferase
MPLHTDSQRYIRYLAAKRKIDDRSLSQSVWRKLRRRLRQADRRGPLAVIEMGGGIGTMFDRVLDWALAPHLQYTLIEANRAYLAEFESRLKRLPFIRRIRKIDTMGRPHLVSRLRWKFYAPISMRSLTTQTCFSDGMW